MTRPTKKLSEWLNYTDRQKEAHEAVKNYKYVLYGGAVGGGKSYWLLKETALQLLLWGKKYGLKGIQAGIFCKDYPSLEDRQLKMVEALIGDFGTLVRSPYPEFRFHQEYGGHIIMFRNLDQPAKYKSTQFALIAVDEVNENSLKVFDELRVRLRWAGIEHTKFLGSCNPIGEYWVEQYWIRKTFPPEMLEEKDLFMFVQSLPTDNPYLDKSYFKSLESLPEGIREAYLKGTWGALEALMDEKGFIRLLTSNQISKVTVPEWYHEGFKVLGIDAGAGVDETSMVLRSRNYAEVVFNQKLSDTSMIKPVALELVKKYNVDYIAIDSTGLGKPIYDNFISSGVLNIIPVNFATSAQDKDRFENKKTEIFWKAKEWVERGNQLKDQESFRQLSSIKYKIFDDKKIKLQSKQELIASGIPSPNVADAFAITFAIDDSIIRGYKELAIIENMWDNSGKERPSNLDFDFI
jgi:phage terminase large subunit